MKNRHLLGFDSPAKALLTAVREAVDNALDACEEARILPEVRVEVTEAGLGVHRVAVQDNGPGIVEEQVGKIFGKLLYGSRFHKLSQSRGQQGLGISAAGMYAQLTTGKPVVIRTRVKRKPATELVLSIDTTRNRPDFHRKARVEWDVPHGTRVELELEAQHRSGAHSVERYLKLTAIANPHVTLRYVGPDGVETVFARTTRTLPPVPKEIKPHPEGVELGRLVAMLKDTEHKRLGAFLQHELSRVGAKTAKQIIELADRGLTPRSYPRSVARRQAAALHRALRATPVSAPTTDCVAPIGEKLLGESLRREVPAELVFAVSRPPAVYRGNPFAVEVALAYGHRSDGPAEPLALLPRSGEAAALLRFANRVPLLFQQGACAMTQAVLATNWRSYGLTQPKGALPQSPMLLLLHIASVWVPFTSESKEAVAAYPEIQHELMLALRECGRKLRAHLKRLERSDRANARRARIEKYLPHVGGALEEILSLAPSDRDALVQKLAETLRQGPNGRGGSEESP